MRNTEMSVGANTHKFDGSTDRCPHHQTIISGPEHVIAGPNHNSSPESGFKVQFGPAITRPSQVRSGDRTIVRCNEREATVGRR